MSLFKKLNTSEQNPDQYIPATSANSATFQARVAKVAGLAALPVSQNQLIHDQEPIYWAMKDAISLITEVYDPTVEYPSYLNRLRTETADEIRFWRDSWVDCAKKYQK